MNPTLECPACGEEIPYPQRDGEHECPKCKVLLEVNADADFRDGHWVNLTSVGIVEK